MKLAYVTPTIRRLDAGGGNPFRHGHTNACTQIDGVSVASLAKEFGSPLFVFSEATLRRKYREAHRAFARHYPDVQFAWSYKTNYLNAICNAFHQEGAIAEVVSDFEYEKARHNGIPGRDIIFNGPYKSRESLMRAIDEKAMIQVDNLDELLTLTDIAKQRSIVVPIALRIHINTHTHEVWSKFGFSGDNGEAEQILRRLTTLDCLRLRGLHCHVGTFILDPVAYRIAASRLVELAVTAQAMNLGPIEYLNLGGGFASKARLHGQYLPPDQVTPSIDSYAEAICSTIQTLWPTSQKLPRLYLETGRALIDEAGWLISTVVAVKTRPIQGATTLPIAMAAYGKGGQDLTQSRSAHGKGLSHSLSAYGKNIHTQRGALTHNAIVIDAGVHLLYTATWYQPTILPAKATADPLSATTVYGCLCMNIDVVREEAPLPSLTTGDQIVMHPVGAYNVTQAMQFIQYRPAVVMIDEAGCPRIIRRKEDLRYVQEMEEMPAHLAKPN
ncbi:MAG: alanine racemase [Verrucomicrobiaceae bacterium]|nr:alanine racemase [Verrucomicrobiaceae bacterium]